MQDRLKFRFWHKPTNKMVDCYGFNEDFVFGDTLDGIGTKYNPAKFEDCILMQCTGLKDKNGKLIYEGDIVQFYDDEFLQTMKIVWDDDELDFKAIGLKKSVEYYGQDFLYLGYIKKEDSLSLEVIGNIYQDLLKEES